MARLESSRDYVGAVDHPETGELIQLNESHPKNVCEAVADAYHFLRVESEGESADAEDNTPAENDSTETETLRCGVNGCKRSVDDPSETCWQHD